MNFRSITSISALLIIACLGVGFFVLRPQWQNYSAVQAQLAAVNATNKNLQDGLNSLQNFLNTYKSTSAANTQAINQSLPVKSADLTDFVSGIGQMAQASGVLLSNFSVVDENSGSTKPTPANAIQAVSISMAASGSFPSFKDLMLRIENYLRVVDISHITLKADDSGTIQYQIDFKTYYQK